MQMNTNKEKDKTIELIVLALIATPNMLFFIVKSFREADILGFVFGYIMVALLIGFWIGVVVEIVKNKRSKNGKADKYNKNEKYNKGR